MTFNSIPFLLFFPAVLAVYFLIPSRQLRLRNLFLLAASYFFYMWCIPAYALILLACTTVTYLVARQIGQKEATRARKQWLATGIVLNVGVLVFFKYFRFLAENITTLLQTIGVPASPPGLTIVLPVGISFYIFQALGYTIDVYRRRVPAERDFFTYALFVAFFPQLVAGPIERSYHLLPQFRETHRLEYENVAAGTRMMVWGYFLKLVLADRCALYVDAIFNNVPFHNGGSYLLATLLFTFQIYGDFAGYSLIAIGAARVLGFRLMENFHRPYLAVSLTDFWRRWHISLSSWFKEYLYFPLGGSRVKPLRHSLNLFVTFMVSGLWHGANWTFICWGALHGILMVLEKNTLHRNDRMSGWLKPLRITLTFLIVSLLWVLFRANNLQDALTIYQGIFTHPGKPFLQEVGIGNVAAALLAVMIVGIKDMVDEKGHPEIRIANSWHVWIRYAYLAVMIAVITLFGVLGSDQFIYFQF